MSSTNVFGDYLTRARLRRRLLAHLKLWLPDYLAEVERSEGERPDGLGGWEPHEPGELPLPASWRPTNGPVDKWPEDQLPAVIVTLPGLTDGGPRRTGDGQHETGWAVGCTAVVSGPDQDATEWLVDVYTAALRLLWVQQPMVEGLLVRGVSWEDEAYDELPFERARSLQSGTVVVTLQLGAVASAAGGPSIPTEQPELDPGPFPTYEPQPGERQTIIHRGSTVGT